MLLLQHTRDRPSYRVGLPASGDSDFLDGRAISRAEQGDEGSQFGPGALGRNLGRRSIGCVLADYGHGLDHHQLDPDGHQPRVSHD